MPEGNGRRPGQLKTRIPLIITARIAPSDLEPFDTLRRKHFPPDRNFLPAHLTMFHRLPGEYLDQIVAHLETAGSIQSAFFADVNGIRHLGAGAAFTIASPELHAVRSRLKASFSHWLVSQDTQTWRPHITVQNKVSKASADALFNELRAVFRPSLIRITGLDLWRYLKGPWSKEISVPFPE